MKKLLSGWTGRALSLGLSVTVRCWMRSLRYQMSYYDASCDPVHPNYHRPGIYVFWHEYIPFMFYLRGHNDVAMLLSQHSDAEALASATRYVGFSTIRGSTNRGGITALRKMFRQGKSINLTMTPDGPRGPRRELAAGCVYLASRLQLPIIPLGLGYDHPWRLHRAWDKFAIPRPGSRARAIMGPPIMVPRKADRDQLDQYRRQVEDALNTLTAAAERWAESGQGYGEAVVASRQPRVIAWKRSESPVHSEEDGDNPSTIPFRQTA